MVHPVDLGKTEPPKTMSLSDSQLAAGYDWPLEFGAFPCHSQAVERWVKVVASAYQSKVGHNARHQLILSQAKCRSDVRSAKEGEFYGMGKAHAVITQQSRCNCSWRPISDFSFKASCHIDGRHRRWMNYMPKYHVAFHTNGSGFADIHEWRL